MVAVQGLYENGKVRLLGEKPEGKAEVLVIFNISKYADNKEKSEDARKKFDEFSGCIHRRIDDKEEWLEALDEKYAIAH